MLNHRMLTFTAIAFCIGISCREEPESDSKRCTLGGLGINVEREANASDQVYDIQIVADGNKWPLECKFEDGVAADCRKGESEVTNPQLVLFELVNTDLAWTFVLRYEEPAEGVCEPGPESAQVVIRANGNVLVDREITPEYEEYCTSVCGSHRRHLEEISLE